ncbi:hypothetical protein OIDMADRAFT_48686 [Oidiodendron maius Zn]|uniref:Enoyl reductase (ER) domain-containing protein n=1 Tax=Oidiodendron maius (strain Zn) TaxID=913774 RepID=A0A0C3DBX0_OIDMZ|nr:hypothetical protein OIDMADRAFT_48686 [Oidiodendron maius Zn]
MSSITLLPTIIDAHLNAINARNNDAIMSTFGQNAVVIDEGKQYPGLKEIREWSAKALVAHNASIDVQRSMQDGSSIVVHVIMDGNFKSDYGITEPFPLFFNFVIEHNLITLLTITPWDPTTTPSMKALLATKTNSGDPISTLQMNYARPQPKLAAGWVKVKVAAASLNYHDIFTMRGYVVPGFTLPRILGCDGAGTLEDGRRVVLYPCMGDSEHKGDETLDPKRHVLSELTDGTLSEYVIVPKRNAVPLPDGMTFETASVLGVAWLTAYRMLFTKSGLRAGQTMLVQGASGGVTTALIQMGAAAGMRVWCTGRTAEKRALGLRLGAEQAFEPGVDLPDKVDAVFDTSGEVTWAHTMGSVKPGGTVITCGIHSGGAVSIQLTDVFVDQVDIRGCYLGTLKEFEDLIMFVTAKAIKPHIGLAISLDQAIDGFKKMLNGQTEGKIVITI